MKKQKPEGIRHIYRGLRPVKLSYVRDDILGFQKARFNAESSGEKDGSPYKWEV